MAETMPAEPGGEVGQTKPVSETELITTFQGPALHSNRIIASNFQAGMRITFLEQYGTKVPAQFRACVLLSYPDAIAMRDLLNRQLREIEPQVREMDAKVKASETKASEHGG